MSATFPQLGRDRAPVHLTVYVALSAWLLSWVTGTLLGQVPIQLFGGGADSRGLTAGTALGTAVAWACLVTGAVLVSHRFGTTDPVADYGIAVRPVDLLGVPIGVAAQLALVPALYWPLVRWWPGTFDDTKLEKNARDLVDATHGAGWVLLAGVVVVGAPLVEELVYRGMLHGASVRRFGTPLAVVISAAFFAVIHFRPVEYPGLFAIGVVLAVCFSVTRRLGMSVIAHAAFNATALVMVARW